MRQRLCPLSWNQRPKANGLASLGLRSFLIVLVVASFSWPDVALAKKEKKKKASKGVGEVVGRVIDQTGATLAGVLVRATPANGEGESAEKTTAKDGEFSLRFEKPAGSYLFRLSKEGYREFEGTIAVESGVSQEVEFRLIDEGLGQRRDAGEAFNAGVDAFNAGDLESARSKFEQALSLDAELVQVHLGLADVYYRQGEDAKAAEAIDAYMEAKPEDLQAVRLAYAVHRRLGNQERVQELLGSIRGTPLARNAAVAEFNEGVARQGQDPEAAITFFQAALDIDPTLTAAQLGLASLQFNSGNYEVALQEVQKLLEAEPSNAQGRRIHYLIQDARANPEAAEAFEAYLALEPEQALDLLYRRAELDFRGGELEPATKALLRILQAKPDWPEANYTLGLCYASSGDTGKAKEYLEKFLALAPEHSEAEAAREMLRYY